NHRAQGDGQEPRRALWYGPGTGGRPAALSGGQADPRPAAFLAGASAQVGAAAPPGGVVGGGGFARDSDRVGGERRLGRARPGRAAGQDGQRPPGCPGKGATILERRQPPPSPAIPPTRPTPSSAPP